MLNFVQIPSVSGADRRISEMCRIALHSLFSFSRHLYLELLAAVTWEFGPNCCRIPEKKSHFNVLDTSVVRRDKKLSYRVKYRASGTWNFCCYNATPKNLAISFLCYT